MLTSGMEVNLDADKAVVSTVRDLIVATTPRVLFEDEDFLRIHRYNKHKDADIFASNTTSITYKDGKIITQKSVIEELSLKLNENGYILIEVPNHDPKSNFFLKIFKKDYNQIGLPWHFNHFNIATFEKMLKQYRLRFSKNSIPVLGQSLMMKFNKGYLTFDGTGIVALIFYPLQILIDYITNSYTAIILKIYKK